ncbi:carotenoid biosynthesis protein [Herpetosiphon llansteffanensis]
MATLRLGHWLWVGYLFVWAWSVPLLAFDLVPAGGEFMATLMLVVPGGLAAWWLIQRYGSMGWLSTGIIGIGSWLTEHLGVTTGWPFGTYQYNGVLLPEIVGVVPLAIPFAWLLVVPGALELSRALMPTARFWQRVLGAASLAMLFDLVIEPVAVYINRYWTWLESGPIFGIPTANFIAWWALALILALATEALCRKPIHQPTDHARLTLPIAIYLLNLALFTVVNLTHQQLAAGTLGLLLLAGFGWRLQQQQTRWHWKYDQLTT